MIASMSQVFSFAWSALAWEKQTNMGECIPIVDPGIYLDCVVSCSSDTKDLSIKSTPCSRTAVDTSSNREIAVSSSTSYVSAVLK